MIRGRVAVIVPLVLLAASCAGGSDPDAGGSSGESWCDVVAASNLLDDEFDAVDPSNAEALEAVLTKIDKLAGRFRDAAPDEISAQVGRYADTNDTLVGIFRDAEFQIANLDEAAIEAAIGGVDDIETEIDVYTVAECGVALGPDDT